VEVIKDKEVLINEIKLQNKTKIRGNSFTKSNVGA
jgi:hypothetical protein